MNRDQQNRVKRQFIVRPFEKRDRERVRQICCETGFLGNPIDPVFQDRELFADYLTRYYTDKEPESSFVIERENQIRGYLLGSRCSYRQKIFNLFSHARLALKGGVRYWTSYNEASRRYCRWVLSRGWRETPTTPKNMAHFHINLLPDSKSVAETHDLIQAFLSYLHRLGEKKVYGQMVVFEGRRGERMFSRYGFEVLDRSEVTKYRELHSEPVYLFTVVKDLEKNPYLYSEKVAYSVS
ncbi:MAG: GNAT family acetyltransferase [Verrucomicrobiae bacterium]|nr:GNAT family acetyltransferase [Verrucomicrobiae bacterium]